MCVALHGVGLLVLGGVCGWTWARAVIASRARSSGLSGRQSEILALVAQGMTTKEIARHEGISEHSVRTHVRRATRTLGVSNRAAAVAMIGGAPRQAVAPPRPRRSATRSSAVTTSPTSSSNGT